MDAAYVPILVPSVAGRNEIRSLQMATTGLAGAVPLPVAAAATARRPRTVAVRRATLVDATTIGRVPTSLTVQRATSPPSMATARVRATAAPADAIRRGAATRPTSRTLRDGVLVPLPIAEDEA